MWNLLLAGLGGFLGAASRYGLSTFTQRLAGSPAFPYGTLVVNVLGCLLIGLAAGYGETRGVLGPGARVFLLAGVLGGFTTYSAFGFETVDLLHSGQTGTALLNVGLQLVLGIGAVWGGLLLGRMA